MRKIILSLFALIGMAGAVSAQTVTVADVEAVPGETVKATLNFEYPADKYTGMQISLQFPTSDFTVAASKAISGWEGLLEYNMKEGKLSYSASGTEKLSSAALDVEFTVGSGVAVGEYDVTISGQLEGPGVDDAPISSSFKLNIVNAHLVTLSENSTEAPKAATGVNVKVERTIAANTWSTGCFPFAMTADQVKAAFGEGVQLGELSGWTKEENDEGDVVAITVAFKSISAIEANRPFIIKVADAVTEFTVEGVDITPESEPVLQVGSRSAERGWMYGTYVAGTSVPEENLFLNGGKFWYSKGSSKAMKAFRGYFEFRDVLAAYEEAASRINITFDDVTAIKGIKTDGEEKIYTLSGQRVNKAGKGVYIVNGKKVIKK
jgi:hypothetical protein